VGWTLDIQIVVLEGFPREKRPALGGVDRRLRQETLEGLWRASNRNSLTSTKFLRRAIRN